MPYLGCTTMLLSTLTRCKKSRSGFSRFCPGPDAISGFLAKRMGALEAAEAIGSPHPCVTNGVAQIFNRCQDKEYIQGCFNWSYLCRCARAVGLELASGTTDLDVLCSQIISIFRAGRITRLGDELFSMHMDMLFLRFCTPPLSCCSEDHIGSWERFDKSRDRYNGGDLALV